MSIKNDCDGALKINYNNQTKELKPNLVSVIDFEIENITIHKFSVLGNELNRDNVKNVLIQSVKTI